MTTMAARLGYAAGCGCLLLTTSTLAFVNTPSPPTSAVTPSSLGAQPRAAAAAAAVGAGGAGAGGQWWSPAVGAADTRQQASFWGSRPGARRRSAALSPLAASPTSQSQSQSQSQPSPLPTHQQADRHGFRAITPDDFAQNYQPVDTSGNAEKRAEIAAVLPGVDMDKLCKEVPDVLLWPTAELRARLAVLAEAMPGEDLVAAVSESPTILVGAPYLKKALAKIAELFPGKTLNELMPRYMDSTLGTAPRAMTYPERLDWELPYLDPGLMGNYSVQADLVEAMKRSQHLVFGLWEEDGEALQRFVNATRRAVLAFEARVLFLRDYYPPETFERYYADDLFGETVGFVEDWAKKHPGYEPYLDEKLGGYRGLETFRLKRLPIGEKEELMIQARAEGVLGPDGSYVGAGRTGLLGAGGGEGEGEGEDDDGWDDLDDDGGEAALPSREALEAEDDEFAAAMRQALWTFEVRAGFLERLYGTEAYRGEVIRRARQETAGTAEEFLARYPAYEGHLHEVLDGWQGIAAAEWAGVHVDVKEDQLVVMLQARGRAMVTVQKATAGDRAEAIPAVVTERAAGRSREAERARLLAEEEAALEKLSDEEVKRHWVAYEAYVKKRFPELEAAIEEVKDLGLADALYSGKGAAAARGAGGGGFEEDDEEEAELEGEFYFDDE